MTFDCCICWEADGGINVTQCGHIFHEKCLQTWIQSCEQLKDEVGEETRTSKCPICNMELTSPFRRGSKKQQMIAVKLPRESSKLKQPSHAPTLTSETFPIDLLTSNALESKTPLGTKDQLQIRHNKITDDYKRLIAVYESRQLEGRILDAVSLSLEDEQKRLQGKLEIAKTALQQKSRKRKQNEDKDEDADEPKAKRPRRH